MHDLQRDIDAISRIEVVPTMLEIICRTTGMGFAAVARVTDSRWVACAVRDEIDFGLVPGGELKVATTICNEIRDSGQAVVIDHVAGDGAFCRHPTPAMYGFQSYISVPILRKNGSFFGTLCAIDPRPANLKSGQALSMFRLFAELIAFHLEAQERLASSEAALLDERETANLREQFVAVLGHDLRNPLASIASGTRLLANAQLDEKQRTVLGLIQGSVHRMSELIDSVLDFAKSRMGDGLKLAKTSHEPLAPVLNQIIKELSTSWPQRQIDVDMNLTRPFESDVSRIGQLLSNLLANALAHGADAPIKVRAATTADTFELSVTNRGQPIPAHVAERMFEPFYRATAGSSQQGLGLGLYIASEIARAHGGVLNVTSTPEATRFLFTMPIS